MNTKFIIGLTGSFGSGCSNIARKFVIPLGFEYISLSTFLKEEYRKEFGKEAESRKELQLFGNSLRKNNGSNYLAKEVIKKIEKINDKKYWIVDSFRNPAELMEFRKTCLNFYLLGIFAELETRWERIKNIYKDDYKTFLEDESRDKGEEFEYGQKVSDCFLSSDLVLANNSEIAEGNDNYELMRIKIESYLKLLKKELKSSPTEIETIMAMAYANSERSNCIKRKVGAVIIDQYGNLFSSGYNEVPVGIKTCKQEHGNCYRDKLKIDLRKELIEGGSSKESVDSVIKKYKLLEKCRSLHAEENVILNIARFGSSSAILGSTLYTTTYPCNLCANKIAQVGIRKIVYFEPYPVKESKTILDKHSIIQEPFEGITFRSFFRVYGE